MRGLTKTDANLNDAQIQGWTVIRRVIPYLWPDGQAWVKRRVVAALAVLLMSKVIAVGAPIGRDVLDPLAKSPLARQSFTSKPLIRLPRKGPMPPPS